MFLRSALFSPMLVNLSYQCDCTEIPRKLVKHTSACVCGVLVEMSVISFSKVNEEDLP